MTVSQAQVNKYQSWLVNNPDKYGTEDYTAVWTAYSESFDQATPAAPVQPEPQVRSDTYADYMERVRELERNRPPRPPPAPSNDDFNPATYESQWAPRRGLSRGTDTAQQLYGSTLEGAGKVSGIEALEQYGKEIIDYNTKQLAAQEIATPSTRFKDVRDAEGVWDNITTGLTFAAEAIPEQIPLMAGMAAAGLGASALNAGAVAATGIAAASQVPLLYGSHRERQKEANNGVVNEGVAFLTSLPAAALDAIGGLFIAKAGKFLKLGSEEALLTRAGRAGRGAAQGTAGEVPTEIGQQVIERAQAGLPIADEAAIDEYIEVAVVAGLVGGTFGGGAGALSSNKDKPEADPEVEAPTSITPVTPADVTAQDLEDIGAGSTPVVDAETSANLSLLAAAGAKEEADQAEIDRKAEIETEQAEQAEQRKQQDLAAAEIEIAAQEADPFAEPEPPANVRKRDALPVEEAEVIAAPKTDMALALEEAKRKNPQAAATLGKKPAPPAAPLPQITEQPDLLTPIGRAPSERELANNAKAQATARNAEQIIVSAELLAEVGIPKSSATYKALFGASMTMPEFRGVLETESYRGTQGTAPSTALPPKVRGNISRYLANVPAEQMPLVPPPGVKKRGTRNAPPVKDVTPIAPTTPKVTPKVAPKVAPKVTTAELVAGVQANPTSVRVARRGKRWTVANDAQQRLNILYDTRKEADDVARRLKLGKWDSVLDVAWVGDPVVATRPDPARAVSEPTVTSEAKPTAREKNNAIAAVKEAMRKKTQREEDIRKAAAAKRAEDLTLPNITEYGSFEIDDTTGVREATDVEAEPTATKIDTAGLSETAQAKLDAANKKANNRTEADKLKETRAETLVRENEALDKAMEPDPEAAALREQNEAKQQEGKEPQKARRVADVVKAVGVAPNGGVGKRLATALKPAISGTQAQIHAALNTFKETLPAKSKFRAGIDKFIEEDVITTDPYPAGVSGAPAPTLKGENAATVDPIPKDIKPTKAEAAKLIAQRDAALALYADYSLGNKEELPLLHEALVEAAMPIEDVGIQEAIAEKDLQLVVRRLGDRLSILNSFSLRRIAKALARRIGDTTKVVLVDRLETAGGKLAASSYDSDTDTVYLHINKGLNVHGLLHETTHALTFGELSNKSSLITKQLTRIFNDTKEYLGTAYGSNSLKEFVAEAFSNQEFRMQLARINPEGKPLSALRRFMNSIRRFLNRIIGTSFNDSDTLSLVDTLITGILAPAPKNRNSEMFAENSTQEGVEKLIKRIIDEPVKAMQNLANVQNKATGKRRTPQEGASLGDKALDFLGVANSRGREFFWSTMDDNRLEDVARAIGTVPGKLFRDYHRSVLSTRGEMETFDEQMNKIIKSTSDWRAKAGEKGQKLLNDLVLSQRFGSTIYKANPLLDEATAVDQYGDNSEQMEAWLAQRHIVKQLEALKFDGKTGMDVYKDMQGKYKNILQELLDAVVGTKEKTGLIDDMFEGQEGKETEVQNLKDDIIKRMFDKDFQDTYFPLIRQGRWKVKYRRKNSEKFNPDTDGAYSMEMVETEAEARRLRALLLENDNVIDGSVEIKDSKLEPRWFADAVPTNGFVNTLLKQVSKQQSETEKGPAGKIKREALDGMEEMIVQTFLNALPETSFAQSLRGRDETPGYVHDVLEGLQTKGYDIGRQAKRIKGLSKTNKIVAEITNLEYDNKYKGNETAFKEFQDEVQRRATFVRNPPKDTVWKNLNQFAFVYTIGFNVSSALVNLSQIPLFVAPYLGAKYGYKNTVMALGKATSLVASSAELSTNMLGLDAYYEIDNDGNLTLNKELAPKHMHEKLTRIEPMLNKLRDTGMLKKGGFSFENLNIDDAAKQLTRANKWYHWDAFTAISAVAFNAAERFNRQATALASYHLEIQALEEAHATVKPLIENKSSPENIEKAKKKLRGTTEYAEMQEAAADYAFYTTLETNGGAFLETSAPITKQGLKRTAFMYKGYGMKMNHTMLKAAKAAIWDAYPGDTEASVAARKEAMKQLLGWHASTLFFAGISGMPLYGALKAMGDIWLDDDEEDFDSLVRRYVDEGMFKGAFNAMLGMDVASRVKLTDLLIQDNRYNSGASTEELIGTYLGGPALSSLHRMGRGAGDLLEQEWLRGVEQLVPPGVANAIFKPARVVREGGYTTRRNDPIYDDVTTGELFGQMFGFAPSEYIRRQEETALKKNISRDISTQRSGLMGDMYQALRMGDKDLHQSTLEAIYDYNVKHHYYPITMESLERSIKGNMKTTANSHYGASFSPVMQRAFDQFILPEQAAYDEREG
jgi:hypothetical protein